MQTHLVSNKLNSSEAKFLFKIRTCMLGVKTNFKEKFKNNLSCQESLLVQLSILKTRQPSIDLFSYDLNIVVPALKKFRALWRKREILLSNKTKNSFEADKWPMSSYVVFYNKMLSLTLCNVVTI